MSDQLVTPAKPPSPVQINVDAIYPLNDSPILQVHYGGANAQRKPTLVRDRAPPSASVNLCMQTAARLGQAIILHPQGLRTATRTLSDNGKDDTIVAAAIRLALSSTNWLVFIDASLPLDTFGLQHRPDVGHFSAEKALSFYINNWHVCRLSETFDRMNKDQSADARLYYYRHLLLTGIGFAHEVIHALRCLVFYILRNYSPSVVPYNAPNRTSLPESGWDFVTSLLSGATQGSWVYDTSTPSPPKNNQDLLDNEAILAAQGIHISFQNPPTTSKKELKTAPFDYLSLKKDGQVFQVDDEWIKLLVEEFEASGELDQITFPPVLKPELFRPEESSHLGLRHQRQPDIVRP